MNIYDKALDNLSYYSINDTRRNEIIKALERAKKVEELLELYQKFFDDVVNDTLSENEHIGLAIKIKALEEELK